MRRLWPWVVVLVVAVGLGLGVPRWSAARSAAAWPVSAADLTQARSTLEGLRVADRGPLTGYDRDLFGDGWLDTDHNGCDTRNDVLARDLTGVVVDDGCTVRSGSLTDPYTGEVVEFVRGPQSDVVQIDHVVALADAWRTGAAGWDDATRAAFANDPANLLAVGGAVNQEKGAGDAAQWVPRTGYRCVYVITQIRVKDAYGLWVTAAERDALADGLDGCRTG